MYDDVDKDYVESEVKFSENNINEESGDLDWTIDLPT